MTKQKKHKQRIRAHMSETGQRYTEAKVEIEKNRRLYNIHLGLPLSPLKSTLAHALEKYTITEALDKLEQELQEAVSRIRLLRKLPNAKFMRTWDRNNIVVEVEEGVLNTPQAEDATQGLTFPYANLLEPLPHRRHDSLDESFNAYGYLEDWIPLIRKIGDDPQLREVSPIMTVPSPLKGAVMAEAFERLEREDFQVPAVIMATSCYADMRKLGHDILHQENRAVLLKKGVVAMLWGARILVERPSEGRERLCRILGVRENSEGQEEWAQQKLWVEEPGAHEGQGLRSVNPT